MLLVPKKSSISYLDIVFVFFELFNYNISSFALETMFTHFMEWNVVIVHFLF